MLLFAKKNAASARSTGTPNENERALGIAEYEEVSGVASRILVLLAFIMILAYDSTDFVAD